MQAETENNPVMDFWERQLNLNIVSTCVSPLLYNSDPNASLLCTLFFLILFHIQEIAVRVTCVELLKRNAATQTLSQAYHSLIDLLIHSAYFIKHTFTKHLVYLRHCARNWGTKITYP